MNYPIVTYHRGHRVTVQQTVGGFSVEVTSETVSEVYGVFTFDFTAHEAACRAIDEKLGIDVPAAKLGKIASLKRFSNGDKDPEPTDKGTQFFGKRLKWARSRARMSIAALEKRTGVSRQQIGWFEGMKAFPAESECKKIARVIDCEAAWLMDGTGESGMIWAKGK